MQVLYIDVGNTHQPLHADLPAYDSTLLIAGLHQPLRQSSPSRQYHPTGKRLAAPYAGSPPSAPNEVLEVCMLCVCVWLVCGWKGGCKWRKSSSTQDRCLRRSCQRFRSWGKSSTCTPRRTRFICLLPRSCRGGNWKGNMETSLPRFCCGACALTQPCILAANNASVTFVRRCRRILRTRF